MEYVSIVEFLRLFFSRRGVMTYIVGGFLRDTLLGETTNDLDLAVKGDAMSIARELAMETGGTFVPLDDAKSVARVILPKKGRVSGQSAQSHVDVCSFIGDITEDLANRDFTIDAMALSLSNSWSLEKSRAGLGAAAPDREHIIDPFGGLVDLADGVVRSVSDSCFMIDPARLLRCVRLAAQLGFSINFETYEMIKRDSYMLADIAPERIRDELLKTLAAGDCSGSLRLMDELGLLCRVIPELDTAKGVSQPKEHYWDVFFHCIETPGMVDRITTEQGKLEDQNMSEVPWHHSMGSYFDEEVSDGHIRRTMIKLAGLLHDVAKPATKTTDPTGRMRFFGHDIRGSEVCEEILRRLRLSSRGINLISNMVRHHLRPTQMSHGVDMPTPRATYRYFRDLGDAAIDTLYLNMADYLAAKGPTLNFEDWQYHCRLINHILYQGVGQQGMEHKSSRLVDGHMLMERFGLSPGAQIGRLLEAIREAQASGEIGSVEEAIQLAERLVAYQ